MKRTTTTRLGTAVAVLTAAALAAPSAVAAPQVPADDATPGAPAALDEDHRLNREVARAAQDAQVRLKGTPPGRATPATDALDAGMAKVVADGAVGVTVRVDSPGLTWRGSAGVRDVGAKSPAGWQDRFRVASNTKTMVATLVLQEVERGSWTLDTRVEDVIPGLFPDHPDVTIRQLLSHTSGAPNGTLELFMLHLTDGSIEDQQRILARDYEDQEHIDAINAVPWTEPGQFFYSNAGYVALGMLLEAQTGRTVGDLLAERVFAPAGMRHSSYPDDAGVNGPFLREDAWVGEGWTADGWMDLDGFDPDFFSHAGAAVSTTADLNAFNEALLTGELVDPALLQEMMTPAAEGPILYGLGLYAVADPCSADPTQPDLLWGHDGASYGTQSVVLGSLDGTRQLSLGVTGRDLSGEVPRWDLNDVLVPALMATCS